MKSVFPIITVLGFLLWPLAGIALGNGAICIVDSTDIRVKNDLTATVKVYKTLEITSEAGAGYAEVTVPINDFIEISDIKGHTILPDGRRIGLKSSDIQTASATEIREFGGYRVVIISLRSPVAGARIHYEYALKVKSLLYLPRIVRRDRCEVRRFAVRLRWQNGVDMEYNYGGLNLDLKSREAKFFGDNLRELSNETNSCPDDLSLMISAGEFKYDRKRYQSKTWPEVGYFYESRAAGNGAASRDAGILGGRLVKGAVTLEDTIKTIFDFVADSVSYVALELGRSDFDPHPYDLIVQRRFGDCKDQSALLSSLFRGVGIEAYPALVATGGYAVTETAYPWPSFFDHVAVVIRKGVEDIFLDPSEPYPRVGFLPSRLRGRYYLIADGRSELQKLPSGPEPSTELAWRFTINPYSEDDLAGEFLIEYINDAAQTYGRLYAEKNREELSKMLELSIREDGWHIFSGEVDSIFVNPETLSVRGKFMVKGEDMDGREGLAVGSSILEYLLKNLFGGVRRDNYCQSSSYRLMEVTTINYPARKSPEIEEYDQTWVRDQLEFSDELARGENSIVYKRTFDLQGGTLPVSDYNAFRDFILSLKNQRYVNPGK